ncbi:hypothetical protein CH76_05870 [Lysinibacillus sp. BF-4]|uniref:DUF3796 domain-containing protein n=1 Tax=Metalysinibacillus saudimassiliensis TaxID=1461583 RepID=A0A078M9Z0_9BACL|nr:hypothetical protein [Lysinibacillus sp. BF-4]KFL43610.1 hypothetical protein CH76_05870 [Lysinibacillus sp. BF-4]CEA03059.1 hypothetical protein BN1050_01421 [Metalysinibacillus saudimassiliensis]
MYENFDWLAFLLGLPLALLIVAIVLPLQRRALKKQRALDERYVTIHTQGRSFAWMVTSIALAIVWLVVLFIEPIGTAFFVLTFLWIVHFSSWLIGAVIASKRN